MMNELKIEKGVPVPSIGSGLGSMVDTIRRMDVGDSVFEAHQEKHTMRRRQVSWVVAFRREGRRAKTRSVDGGLRIWRVE